MQLFRCLSPQDSPSRLSFAAKEHNWRARFGNNFLIEIARGHAQWSRPKIFPCNLALLSSIKRSNLVGMMAKRGLAMSGGVAWDIGLSLMRVGGWGCLGGLSEGAAKAEPGPECGKSFRCADLRHLVLGLPMALVWTLTDWVSRRPSPLIADAAAAAAPSAGRPFVPLALPAASPLWPACKSDGTSSILTRVSYTRAPSAPVETSNAPCPKPDGITASTASTPKHRRNGVVWELQHSCEFLDVLCFAGDLDDFSSRRHFFGKVYPLPPGCIRHDSVKLGVGRSSSMFGYHCAAKGELVLNGLIFTLNTDCQ